MSWLVLPERSCLLRTSAKADWVMDSMRRVSGMTGLSGILPVKNASFWERFFRVMICFSCSMSMILSTIKNGGRWGIRSNILFI